MAEATANESTGLTPSDDFIDQFLETGGSDKDETADTSTDETGTEEDETPEGQLDTSEEGGTEDAEEEGDDEEDSTEDDGNEEEDESEDEEDESEDEEDSETDEEDEDDDSSFLSKATLKEHQERINKDPSLKAVYKSMQADFTRKTTEVKQIRDEYQQATAEYDEFYEALSDVNEGGGREKFLVDAALDNPEAFQRAFDRAAELLENPEDRKKFERERDVDERERKIAARDKAEARQKQQERVDAVHATSEDFAKQFGITDERGLRVAKRYVAQVILENRTAGKHKDVFITDEQVRQAVKEAADDIKDQRDAAAKDTGRKLRKERHEDVKKTAKNSKRRVAPKGKRLPTTLPKPPKPQPGVDPLDARIDQVLGA